MEARSTDRYAYYFSSSAWGGAITEKCRVKTGKASEGETRLVVGGLDCSVGWRKLKRDLAPRVLTGYANLYIRQQCMEFLFSPLHWKY